MTPEQGTDKLAEPGEQQNAGPPAPRAMEPRQPVDARAVLHLVSVGLTFPGRLVDLSLHGCCLQTDQPFPLGIYRRVEAEFQLRGQPVRLAGVTQAIHDHRTIGIRFLDVSPRKLEQLQQLIAEIEAA